MGEQTDVIQQILSLALAVLPNVICLSLLGGKGALQPLQFAPFLLDLLLKAQAGIVTCTLSRRLGCAQCCWKAGFNLMSASMAVAQRGAPKAV